MPPRNVLIKPVSGSCNLRCRYCFYHDEMENRSVASYGAMSEQTLEQVIAKTIEAAEGQCFFGFQGGEPTLAGIDFFRRVVDLQHKYGRKGLQVHNAIQTNGTLLNASWAKFLRAHDFLVGVSVDGDERLHNLYRRDASGGPTFGVTRQAIGLLEEHGVSYNVLTVVTAQTAKNIRRVYGYYKRQGWRNQQYIPCLDSLKSTDSQPYTLTPALYTRFLTTLFDLWYEDRIGPRPIYNRYFENLLGMCLGHPAEACGMMGSCSIQYAVEADGSVYPCDFYMLDAYRLGSFCTDTVEQMDQRRVELAFVDQSRRLPKICQQCQWRTLCRGGCRRERLAGGDGLLGKNRYCESLQSFFPYAVPKLLQLARQLT